MTGSAVGIVLDAGALVGVDRAARNLAALLARAAETGAVVAVPAPVLARVIRSPARQARLARLIRQPSTAVVALDHRDALAIGVLLAASGTRDVVDAHVVVCAQRSGRTVLSGDADHLRRLDPSLRVVAV